METRIPVTNNTAMPMYVGSNMVPPGETRDFPESQVPAHLRPAAEPVAEDLKPSEDPVAALAAGTVKDAVEQIPGLSLADLERLGELEQLGKARASLLSAISDALLSRAQDAHLNDLLSLDDAAVIAALPELSDLEVARAAEMEQASQARSAVIEALAAEAIKRQR